jgi:hypothetical protein
VIIGVVLVAALLGGALETAPPAGAVGTCSSKPAVFPVDQLEKGLTGTGYTVIDGTTQTPFDVEILGVLQDGIYPGVDFILAKITGPQSFLDQTGGIVAGMSGSPVYIDDKLVGSTSYGFFASSDSQQLMGITPAEEMVKLFDYPEGSSTASHLAKAVRLSPSLRRTAARAEGVSVDTIPATAQQLMLPLAVGGLSGRHFHRFSRLLAKKNLPVIPYRSGSAPAPQGIASPTPLQPGDGFAAALSYGDLSIAGIGTTTATCGNLALAFGHPFFFSGPTTLGVNGADVLAIVKVDLFGGYKLANVTADLHGTMDQDRLLGVREIDGAIPDLTPVTAAVTNTDIPKVRIGETDVVTHLDLPEIDFLDLPFIAALSEVFEQDVAFDRFGDGSSALQWKIEGTGPDGEPFTLSRDDKFFSPFDATFESFFELYPILETLQNNKFGDITFTHVSQTGTITQDQLTSSITKVLSASSLQPRLEVRRRLNVKPGDTIRLRVFLLRHGATAPRRVDLVIDVPRHIRGGGGEVSVGPGRLQCASFFGGSRCKASTFGALLSKIANSDHNYDLVSTLSLSARTKSGGRRFQRKAVATQPDVVLGHKFIRVEVQS